MQQRKRIAIIGQGVIGLTSAARLLRLGFAVDIYSRGTFSQTTSMAAGAYWWPHKAYPEERVSQWAKETYQEYRRLKADSGTGVTFEKHFRFCLDPDENAYALNLVDEWQEINGTDYGIPCAKAYLIILPVIDVPTYLPYLKSRVESDGAKIFIKDLSSPAELFPAYDLVVNCSGIGARSLVHDESVFPIRGQVIRISHPPHMHGSIRIYQRQGPFTLILPRSNDCILGGTAQEGDWSLAVRKKDTRQILKRCSKVVPAVAECTVLSEEVGLRPGRKEVRLELEIAGPSRPIVHNYGHGGGGFTVAWGCANGVASVVQEYFA